MLTNKKQHDFKQCKIIKHACAVISNTVLFVFKISIRHQPRSRKECLWKQTVKCDK